MTTRILLPACTLGLLALIIVPLLVHIAQAAARGKPSAAIMALPMTVAMIWAGWTWGAHGVGWRLRAHNEGITLSYGSRTMSIAWSQIDACREEGSPSERDGASWVTLCNAEDNTLLQWERSWFGHSQSSLREFDRFTAFVQQRIAEQKAASTST